MWIKQLENIGSRPIGTKLSDPGSFGVLARTTQQALNYNTSDPPAVFKKR